MKKERPESKRPKMPLSQRAKQFAPFDALTGLSERLRQAEEEHNAALNDRAAADDTKRSDQNSIDK